MTPEPMLTLVRYVATVRPRTLTPFRWVAGSGWVANSQRVYVRRVKGLSMAVSLVPRHGYASLLTQDELDFVHRIARRRLWSVTAQRRDLTIPRYTNLDGDLDCDADLLRRLNAVAVELGVVIFVRSGKRTMAEQWDLYRRLGPMIAAYPSELAPHVRGVAADCGINGRDIGEHPGARDAMKRHGLCLRVPGEDWHVEVGDTWAA